MTTENDTQKPQPPLHIFRLRAVVLLEVVRGRTARRKRRRPGLHCPLLESSAMGGIFQGEKDCTT
jgi:hypothetical protein